MISLTSVLEISKEMTIPPIKTLTRNQKVIHLIISCLLSCIVIIGMPVVHYYKINFPYDLIFAIPLGFILFYVIAFRLPEVNFLSLKDISRMTSNIKVSNSKQLFFKFWTSAILGHGFGFMIGSRKSVYIFDATIWNQSPKMSTFKINDQSIIPCTLLIIYNRFQLSLSKLEIVS